MTAEQIANQITMFAQANFAAWAKYITEAENQRRADWYRREFENWAGNRDRLMGLGQVIPPAPVPPKKVQHAMTPEGYAMLGETNEPVCEPLSLPSAPVPQQSEVAVVGPAHIIELGQYQVGPGDTMPNGAVVTQNGVQYRKVVYILPFGKSQYYQRI